MFEKNDLGEYQAQIGRLTFVCDEMDTETEKIAAAIAECYNQKLNDIAAFMIDDGIDEYFNNVSYDNIVKSLGLPLISLDRNTITYPDNSFDDSLIIEFHFKGILDEFYGLDIDG